ncbi:MAG: 4-phosphoerythronate dehydrogenase [Chlorobiota bacterium]
MRRLVCCFDPKIPLLAEFLGSHVDLRPIEGPKLSRAVLRQLRCDALFVRAHTRVDASLVEGTSVRFVGTPSSGIDHITVGELQELGITVAHAPGCNANAVAEYVIVALLLWEALLPKQLSEECLGIVGFGHIGRRVARYARRLGMEVWVYDPPLARQGFEFPEWVRCVPTLRELCRNCSATTLHVPLTRSGPDATWHLLDSELLAEIPSGALLIQTSRGGVVAESALEVAIAGKQLSTAIDVWEHEPRCNWRLAENALLATPHIAGYTWQARVRCTYTVVRHFAAWARLPIPEAPLRSALESVEPPPSTIPWEDRPTLLRLLLQRRKVDVDSHTLRSWRHFSPSRQEQAFRSYRDNYPRRPETLWLPEDSPMPCQ